MKKILIIISIVIGLNAWGQKAAPKHFKNALIFIPHKIFYDDFTFGFERELSTHNSLYALSQVIYREDDSRFAKGFVQSIGLKRYVFKGEHFPSLQSVLYFMPYIQAGSIDMKEDFYVNHQQFSVWGGGFQIGLGFTFFNKVGMSMYFGGAVMHSDFPVPEGLSSYIIRKYWNERQDWRGVMPKGGIEVSYKF